MDSILNSVKKLVGIDAGYTAFDTDIILHTNSAFSTLSQLGLGPVEGFMIEDAEATWADFVGSNLLLNPVKTYVVLRVRMLFDPPTTSYLVDAMKAQIQELEWRLNVQREDVEWVDPNPPKYCVPPVVTVPPVDDDPLPDDPDTILILDGGTP